MENAFAWKETFGHDWSTKWFECSCSQRCCTQTSRAIASVERISELNINISFERIYCYLSDLCIRVRSSRLFSVQHIILFFLYNNVFLRNLIVVFFACFFSGFQSNAHGRWSTNERMFLFFWVQNDLVRILTALFACKCRVFHCFFFLYVWCALASLMFFFLIIP